MFVNQPRIVMVTRKSPLEMVRRRHGTLGQAQFFFKSRQKSLALHEQVHRQQVDALGEVDQELPSDRRRVRVDREELSRFLFAPDDIVVVIGQDGLVANVAKYLNGQPVVGINPDPGQIEGVLCRHPPSALDEALDWIANPHDGYQLEKRIMVEAVREDGQRLLALNEVFVGHRSHQSARYRIRVEGRQERQSSSGVIVASGTGGTGWARSITRQRHIEQPLPGPQERRLAWFVREPWPSKTTGDTLTFGLLAAQNHLAIDSEMEEGGRVFADGIETDYIEFLDGQHLEIQVAPQTLNLVVPAARYSRRRTRADD